jgi:hypothetical protein
MEELIANRWVTLNAAGFGFGLTAAMMSYLLPHWKHEAVATILAIALLSLSVASFQSLAFHNRRLRLRWALGTASMFAVGFATAVTGLLLPAIALLFAVAQVSSIATVLAVGFIGIVVTSLTGVAVAFGQSIAASGFPLRHRSWLLRCTASFAVAGAVIGVTAPLGLLAMPTSIPFPLVIIMTGSFSGAAGGALAGWMSHKAIRDLVALLPHRETNL